MIKTDQLKLYGFALMGFIIMTILFWPGMMSPDSSHQLGQAQTGIFSNHNPIMMTWLWFWLNKIIKGPGLIFLLHTTVLWISVVLFALSVKISRRWLFCLIPLWPTLFAYTQLIWKDVSFSYSFLLVISWLAWFSATQKKPGWGATALMMILLLYGVGTKYQAIYCVPVVGFWLVSLRFPDCSKVLRLGGSLLITGALYGGYQKIEESKVQPAGQINAWQMARLYDLAGISVRVGRPLFPVYVLDHPPFSLERLQRLYSAQNVDALIYGNEAILPTTQNPQYLNEVLHCWVKAVLTYPVAYLQHRARVWLKLINKKPDNYFLCLRDHADTLWLKSHVVPAADLYMSVFPSLLTRFYWVIAIALWALARFKKLSVLDKKRFRFLLYGPLICFTQLFVYFFLSMASDLRYLYLSNCIGVFLLVILLTKRLKISRHFE